MAEVNVRELHNAVDDLANATTQYYDNEHLRGDAATPHLTRIFSAHSGTRIPQLLPAAIDSIISDGHNNGAHGGGLMVVKYASEIMGIASIPQIELLGCLARLNARMDNEAFRQLYLRWRLPFLGLTIVGELGTYFRISISPRM